MADKNNIRTKTAFWLLVIPYIILVFSIIALKIVFDCSNIDYNEILSGIFSISILSYPLYAIPATFASIVCQIAALCNGETKIKNTVMLICSGLTLLFIVFLCLSY